MGGQVRLAVAMTLGDVGGVPSVGGAPSDDLVTGAGTAVVISVNERTFLQGMEPLDYAKVREDMDPLDSGLLSFPKSWKNAVSYFLSFPATESGGVGGQGFPSSYY